MNSKDDVGLVGELRRRGVTRISLVPGAARAARLLTMRCTLLSGYGVFACPPLRRRREFTPADQARAGLDVEICEEHGMRTMQRVGTGGGDGGRTRHPWWSAPARRPGRLARARRRSPSPSSVTSRTATRRSPVPEVVEQINADPRSVRRPPRRHQERLVALQRRVLRDDPRRVRPLPRSARLHAGRQRVDRLPPRQQRRLQPARAAGRRPVGVLPAARAGRWARSPSGDLPGGRGFPENVRYAAPASSSPLLHIVGSNNGLAPWTGRHRAPTPEQAAEVQARTADAIGSIRDAFDDAARDRRPSRGAA